MAFLSNVECNAPTILFAMLGSLTVLVSGLFLTNNEESFITNDNEKRLLSDTAYLVRSIGDECFMIGMLAWCSICNGHSQTVARWWAVGVIPSVWNKAISGDQGGAVTNTSIAMICLAFGWRKAAWNGPAVLLGVLGSLALLVSTVLLTNNEESIIKNDIERRLLSDTGFLIRGVGDCLALLGTLAWCSVVNGHSAALARWWAVGLIPSIWNKAISGDQGGAVTNATIAMISLYVGCRASGFTRKAELAVKAAKLA